MFFRLYSLLVSSPPPPPDEELLEEEELLLLLEEEELLDELLLEEELLDEEPPDEDEDPPAAALAIPAMPVAKSPFWMASKASFSPDATEAPVPVLAAEFVFMLLKILASSGLICVKICPNSCKPCVPRELASPFPVFPLRKDWPSIWVRLFAPAALAGSWPICCWTCGVIKDCTPDCPCSDPRLGMPESGLPPLEDVWAKAGLEITGEIMPPASAVKAMQEHRATFRNPDPVTCAPSQRPCPQTVRSWYN